MAGVDWGFNNPAAIVVAKVKDAAFYILDEWKERGKTTAEIIDQCKVFKRKYGVQLWFPDPAEPDRIEEMKRASLSIGATNKDVAMGLSHVNSLIREKRLFVHDRCRELIDEMSQYHYEEDTDGKNNREAPVKDNDHLCDALRYMCMGHRPQDPGRRRAVMLNRMKKRKDILKDKHFE